MTKIESVFTPKDRIVSMIQFKGTIFVATEQCVFRMREDDLTETVAFEQCVFHQIKNAQ